VADPDHFSLGADCAAIAPVEHSSIRKRPEDAAKFESLLGELEGHFREPHPARRDEYRQQVLEAIARLRREPRRERAYLPTAIQSLESRVEPYESQSLDPSAKAAQDALTSLLEQAQEERRQCGSGGRLSDARREALSNIAAAQAGRYLAEQRYRSAWLTNYLLDTLLDPVLYSIDNWPRRRLRAMLSSFA
jgi:hypothetical protein